MNVIETSLRRPVTVLICTFALVYFGLMTYQTMGMEQTPDVDLPVVMVTTTLNGASAEVMDNDVTDVLEEELATISGVESISSSSYQGTAVTTIHFELDRDIDAAAADVRDKVNSASADLPDDADDPIIAKYDVDDSPMVMASLSGSASYRDKVFFVDKVAKIQLQAINGVGNVDTPGMRDREIRVWPVPVRLQSRIWPPMTCRKRSAINTWNFQREASLWDAMRSICAWKGNTPRRRNCASCRSPPETA